MAKEIGRENGQAKKLKCPVILPNGKPCGKKCVSVTELAEHIALKHPGR